MLELKKWVKRILKIRSESDTVPVALLNPSTFQKPEKPEEYAVRVALSNLPTSEKPSLPDILASALDQKTFLDDFWTRCYSEHDLLASALNDWWGSMPERVPDVGYYSNDYFFLANMILRRKVGLDVTLYPK